MVRRKQQLEGERREYIKLSLESRVLIPQGIMIQRLQLTHLKSEVIIITGFFRSRFAGMTDGSMMMFIFDVTQSSTTKKGIMKRIILMNDRIGSG